MPTFNYFKKFGYACRGLAYVVRRESSFRLMLVVAIIGAIVGWYLSLPYEWWAVFLLSVGVVLAVEIFNTTLERLLDMVEPRLSIHVELLKNLLAGAVLLASLASAAATIVALVQYFS